MATKITPHLIHLAYEASLKSFWRKKALKRFLKECHVADQHLASWGEEESKREFLDRTFDKLQQSDKGKTVIHKIAISLSDQNSFPDLRNWEDSDQKIADASKCVSELKA